MFGIICAIAGGTVLIGDLWCFSVARPLWIPAFAGMTDAVHASLFRRSFRPLKRRLSPQ